MGRLPPHYVSTKVLRSSQMSPASKHLNTFLYLCLTVFCSLFLSEHASLFSISEEHNHLISSRVNLSHNFLCSPSCLFQTGCSPASAFASFSKHPTSPPKEDRMSRNASGLIHSLPNSLASNIPTFPRSISPASYSPPASPLEGDVVIPCEFCGVVLEEAVVFHHQVRCWWHNIKHSRAGKKNTQSSSKILMFCDIRVCFASRTNVTCALRLLIHWIILQKPPSENHWALINTPLGRRLQIRE